jgi:UDPglucose--hexose-1-phosphate uridylyltransferase
MNGLGAHEVIVETWRHGATLADLPVPDLAEVFWAWRERIVDLAGDERLQHVAIFKNRGAAAGATLEHEHSQLVALPMIPRELAAELHAAGRHFEAHERCVFCDVIRQERRDGARLILENDRFVALAPWASRTPFQTWILPRSHRSHFETIQRDELAALAALLRTILRKLDRALETPAYNLLLHTAPMRMEASPAYHWRIEIAPALTRIGGFEWSTGFFINPTPPEEAAAFLRDASAGEEGP